MQKILDSFLTPYRDKRIAVYGTGLNSERVICSAGGYDFVCVISNDLELIGNVFHGKTVMSLEEAIQQVDVIVIAAIPSSTRVVYERIKNIVPDDMPVFDLSGIQLNSTTGYMHLEYWNIKMEDLIAAIDEHEVISLDVFDTLIMRSLVYPRTLFEIIGEQEKMRFKNYAYKRKHAEDELYREGKHPTITEIYDKLPLKNNAPYCEKDILQDLEVIWEKKLAKRRETIYEAFNYALSHKKKTYLVSDMYLSKTVIDSILSRNDISGYMNILVSCEYRCDKGSGRLFEKLKEEAGTESILHIGDNQDSDIAGASKAGIDSFRILSAEQILLSSSIAHIDVSARNKWDELLLGHILADLKMFNDPFYMGKYKGRVYIDSIDDMTELSFAPITMAYISWIIRQLLGHKNAVVLFASRDGFLLEKIYRKVREESPSLELPKSVYFYTSRKAMSETICDDEDGIRALCANLDQYRKVEIVEHLEKLFGISLREDLKGYEGKRYEEIEQNQLLRDLLNIKEKIFRHANAKAHNYKKYIEKLDIDGCNDIYLVDLVAQGSSRYGLSKMTGKDVKLLALGTTQIPNAFIPDVNDVQSMYGMMVTGVGNAVGTMFNLLEMIYGSDEGQLIGFNSEGVPMLDDSTKYNPELLEKVRDEIFAFIDSYADENWFLREYSRKFANDMLGILHRNYSDINKEVRDYFEFYDLLNEKTARYNVLDDVRGYLA